MMFQLVNIFNEIILDYVMEFCYILVKRIINMTEEQKLVAFLVLDKNLKVVQGAGNC